VSSEITLRMEKQDWERITTLVNVETRERFPLKHDSTRIGREPDNDVCLRDDVHVSAHHARIFFDGKQYWVEDLDSRNGIIKNNEVVNKRSVITAGSVLTIGLTRLRAE
jgi:adenylate cyclase